MLDRDLGRMRLVASTLVLLTVSSVSAVAVEANGVEDPGEPDYAVSVFSAPEGSFEIRGKIRHIERSDCWVVQIDAASPYVEGASSLKELVGLPRELQREGARVVLKVHASFRGACLGSFLLVVESADEED
jgi:hypothetical protein